MKKPKETLAEFRKKIDAFTDDELRIREIIDFAVIYGDCFGEEIISILEESIELSKKIGFKEGEVLCYCNLYFANRVSPVKANKKYDFTLSQLTEMVDGIKGCPADYVLGMNMLSYFHWYRGEYEKAFNLAFEGLKLSEKDELHGADWNIYGIAVFYFDTKDLENSKKYFQKAYDLFDQRDHAYGKARASNGLASIAILRNENNDARKLLAYATDIYRQLGHYAGLSRAVNDIGLLEKAEGNYAKAIVYLKEGIELRKEIAHIQGLITSYTELGEIYQLMNEHVLALEQLQKGIDKAIQINAKQKEMRLHKLFYDSHKELKNTELALNHFEKFFEIRSDILSDEAANNIKKIQTQFEKDKSEKEAELERFKNVELKKAHNIIAQKNKDITDSINYARRIQLGILPSTETLDRCFENYFVLYKPKDIVSGDFYWAVESMDRKTNTKLSIIAAVDCTGHGVPGAFMSMLGNTLLNQTISNPEVRSAGDVLDYLNIQLPENLKSTGADQNIRDGMDMTLCIFDHKNMKMQFAGANNPIWIIRAGELMELKGDKQPISASTDSEKRKFTNINFELQKNDHVYLFTDGFADQFGGPNEKKFSYKRLKELLISNISKTLPQQKEILLSSFNEWKGELEQIDDVCVIGIKV